MQHLSEEKQETAAKIVLGFVLGLSGKPNRSTA